jgi:hypothetical protein
VIRSFVRDTRSESIELVSFDVHVTVAMSRESHRFSVNQGVRHKIDGKEVQVHAIPRGEIRLYGTKARHNVRWDSMTCAFLAWLIQYRSLRYVQVMKRYIPEKCIELLHNGHNEGQTVRAYRQPANHGLSLVCSVRVSNDMSDETCMDVHALADAWHPWTYRVTETLHQQCIISSMESGPELVGLIQEISKVCRQRASVSLALGNINIVVLDCERRAGIVLTGPGVEKTRKPVKMGYAVAHCKATESLLEGLPWKPGRGTAFLVETTWGAHLDAFRKRNTQDVTEDALQAIEFCWDLGIVRGLSGISETEECIAGILEERGACTSPLCIVSRNYFMFFSCIADSVSACKKRHDGKGKNNRSLAEHILRIASQELVPAIAKVGLPGDLRANLFAILRFWKCLEI